MEFESPDPCLPRALRAPAYETMVTEDRPHTRVELGAVAARREHRRSRRPSLTAWRPQAARGFRPTFADDLGRRLKERDGSGSLRAPADAGLVV
jgi:hypothetical protein